jgi:hypothetical protein
MSVLRMTPEQIAKIEEPTVYDIIDRLPSANEQLKRWRELSQIRRIVVHIDDFPRPEAYDPVARYRAQARYHIFERNWNPGGEHLQGFGLMYHYRISGDGRVWRTQPERLVTWHASSWNRTGLAVCCDAAERQSPTDAQLGALRGLLLCLCYRRPDIPAGRRDVFGHTEEPGTEKSCPAKYLPWVQRFRKGEW